MKYEIIEATRRGLWRVYYGDPNGESNPVSPPMPIANARRLATLLEQNFPHGLSVVEAAPTVRHTTCKHCSFDIEGHAPYPKNEWRDRGNNTHCSNTGYPHEPVASND